MQAGGGSILVVDDIESNRFLLQEMLESVGHRVILAPGGAEAIDLAASERPDVVLLDVQMPGMDGYEVCRRLKAMAETASLPIVFVTANSVEESELVRALEIGAYDFLVKPIRRPVLLARVDVMLRIRRGEETVRRLSMVDEFTGLFSKKYVLHRLDEELERARRSRAIVVVSMIDLDDFKRCNDRFGHQFGDEVLTRVSAVLNANVRRYDSVGRYGGEEFMLVQPEHSEAAAVASLERLHQRVGAECFETAEGELHVSFSAGVAAWDFEVSSEELIGRADRALYAAKHAGKARTVPWSDMARGGGDAAVEALPGARALASSPRHA